MTAKALQKCFSLSSNVKLYLPSTLNGSTPAPKAQIDKAIVDTLESFSQWFGGATSYQATGAWYSQDQGQVITEQVVVVEAFATSDAIGKHLDHVVAWAQTIKDTFWQENVAVEHDGILYLV